MAKATMDPLPWGWLLALGFALVVLGVIALYTAFWVTLITVEFFAWLLVASGVLHVVHAFRTRPWGGFFMQLLIGLLQAAVGILVVMRPLTGALSLTLVMAVFFIVEGVFRIGAAAALRLHSWGWQVLSGLLTLLLGLFVALGWPESGLWVIGMFVGIDLIFAGNALVMLALAARRLSPRAA
jgi:uncharacterized membrane protein HdeD (DUF308 family)